MKKSILLIFIALITAIGCQAQEAAKRDSTAISKYQARHTLQGLKAFFETGYLWGLGGEAYIESPHRRDDASGQKYILTQPFQRIGIGRLPIQQLCVCRLGRSSKCLQLKGHDISNSAYIRRVKD